MMQGEIVHLDVESSIGIASTSDENMYNPEKSSAHVISIADARRQRADAALKELYDLACRVSGASCGRLDVVAGMTIARYRRPDLLDIVDRSLLAPTDAGASDADDGSGPDAA
jgi:hypothetical protein